MTDNTAALLMAKMRGEGSPPRATEPPVDPATVEIYNAMRGGSEGSSRERLAKHRQADRQAEQSFESRVAKRAQDLVNRHAGGHYPRETAREQLRREDAAAREKNQRKAVYDAMVKSNRAESEANSTAGLRDRIKASATQRREESTRKLVDSIVAQVLGKTSAA